LYISQLKAAIYQAIDYKMLKSETTLFSDKK